MADLGLRKNVEILEQLVKVSIGVNESLTAGLPASCAVYDVSQSLALSSAVCRRKTPSSNLVRGTFAAFHWARKVALTRLENRAAPLPSVGHISRLISEVEV